MYFLESADGTMKVVVVFSPQEQNIEDPTEEVTDYRKLCGPLDDSVYHIQVSRRDVYPADLCLNLGYFCKAKVYKKKEQDLIFNFFLPFHDFLDTHLDPFRGLSPCLSFCLSVSVYLSFCLSVCLPVSLCLSV